jgi:hypothetical protein
MIEAFKLLAPKVPEAQLVVAGGDHPQAAGYVESVRKENAENPQIEFRGYVPEDELADLFQESSVAVMPYSSSTGCSGVAHLACAFSVPMVSADLPDFRQMAQSEELAIEFYPPGDAAGLADCLHRLLKDPEKQYAMATQNFSAALRMTMPNVVQKYLRHFELQQRVQTLKYIARVRRLPRWIPSKALLLRLLTRNSLSWARRSIVLHTSWSDIPPVTLLHDNGNVGGKLNGSSIPANGNGIAARDGRTLRRASTSAARDGTDNASTEDAGYYKFERAPTVDVSNHHHSGQAEPKQAIGEKESASFGMIRGSSAGSNGQDGTGRIRPWNDGSGSE